MKLSVVTTLYKSEQYIEQFYARTVAAIQKITTEYEIIFVNDCSPDQSLDRVIALSAQDPHVVVVDLARNFGHHKAMMTGLDIADGDLIFLIDSDLDESPELLIEFNEVLHRENCDVVYGYQNNRTRGLLDKWAGELYYAIVNWLSAIKIPRNLITGRLMTRRYVRSLLRHREREIFLAGLWSATGYKQIGVPVTKSNASPSSYTWLGRLSLTLTSMISFSSRPLVFAAGIGGMISFISMLFIIYLIFRRLTENMEAGWASVIASIWFMGGLTIFFIGLVGLYVSKIFVEVKDRPYTIIRDIYQSGGPTRMEGDLR